MTDVAYLRNLRIKAENELREIQANSLIIKKPKFDLYESVYLYWNGERYQTRIVQRLYNPDTNHWGYLVSVGRLPPDNHDSEFVYGESCIEPRP